MHVLKSFALVPAACLVLLVPSARAGLTINLRLPDGATQMALNRVYFDEDVPIEVWASITAADGVNGSGGLFGVTYCYYSIVSQRLLGGINGSIDGNLTGPSLAAPFDATGSQSGLLFPINDDGITDLGSPIDQPVEINFAKPRASALVFNDDPSATVRAIGGGFEFLVETVYFHVDSALGTIVPGSGTRFSPLTPIPHSLATRAANWYQHSTGQGPPADGFNNDDSLYRSGTSVTFVPGPPWQNLKKPMDVNYDTRIEPVDVLTVVNDLNAHGLRMLSAPGGAEPPPYIDVTGDNQMSPQDVLLIINFLNAQPAAFAAVPEPSTAFYALAGIAMLSCFRKRRRK